MFTAAGRLVPGAWWLVTVRIGAGHLVWWRVAGCQHRATGIISSSTNQYHADMEHMFDDVRSRVCGEVTFSFVLIEGAYKCLHF